MSSSLDPSILGFRDVRVRFGGVIALDGVTFEVAAGQTVGVIGPNGAGKTTLFNCISRFQAIDGGDIVFDGRSLLGRPRHRVAELGIARTFQNVALVDSLTALDNVVLGAYVRSPHAVLADALGRSATRRREVVLAREALELLHELGLESVASRRAGDLPFGTRKRLEIARALAARPRLLMLDEPVAGLNHTEIDELTAFIGALKKNARERGQLLTVLLIEHHMNMVMGVSDKVVVLDFGRLIAEGPPEVVKNDPEVIRAYLGAPS
ncbi:MAG TPA: ABC transporter ATP-binding protein [Polyangiaceae bacterium]|jgi:branched-chain amino acid transport system ATP-binding protein|nr:ABC transporter ATP-binding protein [Polyangiaceae bacterium]